MSKKKVAVFANGWSYEYIQQILKGLKEYANEKIVDVDFFLIYTTSGVPDSEKIGEFNLLRLPRLEDYDGVIVLANSINLQSENEYLQKRLSSLNIPCVSLEYELSGIHFMGSDNYTGMYAIAEHLIADHGYKDIVCLSGPANHAEAQERLKAVSDACRKNKTPLTKDRIIYGDFSYQCGGRLLDEYCAQHGSYPRAIICANDMMALGLFKHFQKKGINIPEEIAITGFDGLKLANQYDPLLTTVTRNWDHMGYNAMSMVLEQTFEPGETKRIILNSSLYKNESCGCKLCQKDASSMSPFLQNQGVRTAGRLDSDIHLRQIYYLTYTTRTAQELNDRLGPYLASNRSHFETDNFFMIMDPAFFSVGEDPGASLKKEGYPDEVLSVISIHNREIHKPEAFPTSQLLPTHMLEDPKPHVMFYLPIHSEGNTIGYTAMNATEEQLEEYAVYIWARHIQQCMNKIQNNIQIHELTQKLTILSNTDGLTGLLNRNGYEKKMIPHFKAEIAKDKSVAFIMCDVDLMKNINDNYGHLQGDLALCTLAQAIKDCIPKDWLACRYGGDEFLTIGQCETEDELDELIQRIETDLSDLLERAQTPFRFSASLGGIIVRPEDHISFDAALRIADGTMYRIKRQHKESL